MPYEIREWRERYEVNDKNRAWQPGEVLRRAPLDYIRMPVHGRSWGKGFRNLLNVAGPNDAAACLGVFVKLLELAADNDRDLRGRIVDENGAPLCVRGIADLIGFSEKSIARALKVLADPSVNWIAENDGQLPEIPGIPGNAGNSRSESYTESYTYSESETYTDSETEYLCPTLRSAEVGPQAESGGTGWHPTVARPYLTHSGPYDEADPADILCRFPVKACDDPEGWPFFRLHADQLFAAYCDVTEDRAAFDCEIKHALSWCQNNPKKRKVPGGMPRFLDNWLCKWNEKGGSTRGIKGNGVQRQGKHFRKGEVIDI